MTDATRVCEFTRGGVSRGLYTENWLISLNGFMGCSWR